MIIFAGLGNPGEKYAHNRHNIGFMALDRIAADHGFAPWRARFQALVTDGTLGGQKVMLLKPQTFMNLSGQSVGEALRFHKLDSTDLTVFHDEIDLAPAKIKVKLGGGHAGHNGLRSIHQHIGPAYGRVRLGVGHPGHKDAVPGYVLRDFPKADADWLDDLMRGISDGAAHLAANEVPKFLNAVALRLTPARSGSGTAPVAKAKTATAPDNSGPAETRLSAVPGSARPATPPAPPPETPDPRSVLQRLADRFRG